MDKNNAESWSRDKAISHLLEEHGGLVYNLGLRMCGTPENAEDLVQETFLRAFRNWEQFEGKSNPTTWLYTIASRACSRFKRRRAGEPSKMLSLSKLLPDQTEDIPIINSEDEAPLDKILQEEFQDAVNRAIAALPSHFRIALMLKDVVGLSSTDVAQILGIKKATVKTRVHRARLLLRKELAEKLPKRKAQHPDHSRQACLDLLHAKQEALDRGVTFPLAESELCTRCRSLFSTLDLAKDTCLEIKNGKLPEHLRQLVLKEFGAQS